MDNKFKLYQKEGLSFKIVFKNQANWESYYLSIIVKYTDDLNNNNSNTPIPPIFKKMDSNNFSVEDMNLIRSGVIPCRLSSTQTNIDATDYILQVKITDENNSVSLFILQAELEIKFDYEKR